MPRSRRSHALKKTPDKDETLLTPGKDTVSMPAEGEVTVYAQWEPAMTTLPFTGGTLRFRPSGCGPASRS